MIPGRVICRLGGARAFGLLLALCAVLSPITLGPAVHAASMRAEAAASMAMDDTPECEGGMDMLAPARPDSPGHHAPDCPICPLCAALAHPAIPWSPAPPIPAPSVAPLGREPPPVAARAAPKLFAAAAQPRGPPTRF